MPEWFISFHTDKDFAYNRHVKEKVDMQLEYKEQGEKNRRGMGTDFRGKQ